MKRIGIICLIGLLFIGIVYGMKKEFVIYIDPGHGGYDGGATYEEVTENEIVLPVANYLKGYLDELNVKVKMTRTENVALNEKKAEDIYKRIELMSDADLFISLHANAFTDKKYSGAQVFYSDNNELSESLSNGIQQIFTKTTKTKRVHKEVAGICLLDKLNNPGCLIELGFLSNDDERNELTKPAYQELLAYSIYLGILEYLNQNNLIR